ncbi:MAG: GFA family protein [Alphaproteobacteria bacterium]|nr:GFA family protein [Alphaproteobacteria bacterium]
MQRPAIPVPPHAGGCLCGAVRYRFNARPWALNACHCLDCKKLTGATNLLMILGPRNAFSFEGAVERYRKRADSGNEVDIVRCASCGVRLWHEPVSAPQLVIFAAGTLDDPSWVVPTSHIFTRSASPGVVIQDDALVLRDGPTDRVAIFDAFKRIYGA